MNLKTRYQLVFCILTTLHFIQNDGGCYCYCQDNQKCKMCTIPIIFSGFEKYVENNIFDYEFLLNFAKSWFKFLTTKKNKSNAFRESTNSGVVTGTRANTGAYFSLKAFATMKRYNLIGSNVKNCLYHPNIERKLPYI